MTKRAIVKKKRKVPIIRWPNLYAYRCMKSFDHDEGRTKRGDICLFDNTSIDNIYFRREPKYDQPGTPF